MTKEKNVKELVNENVIRHDVPRHCEEGKPSRGLRRSRTRLIRGAARRGNLLSGLLRHFVVLDFDNSQKRGFARLDVLGGLRRAAHLSKSAPRNDEYRSGKPPTLTLPLRWGEDFDGNSDNLQSLINVKNLMT